MPMNENTAATALEASLLALDYGGVLTPEATAVIQTMAGAFAKCIGHMIANNVISTSITGALAGATPSSPGAFTGTGTGSVAGLVKGDALSGTGLAGEIMAELESADFGGTLTAEARARLALLADAVAVFADHVQNNAQVSTTDTGTGLTPNVNGPATGTGSGNAT